MFPKVPNDLDHRASGLTSSDSSHVDIKSVLKHAEQTGVLSQEGPDGQDSRIADVLIGAEIDYGFIQGLNHSFGLILLESQDHPGQGSHDVLHDNIFPQIFGELVEDIGEVVLVAAQFHQLNFDCFDISQLIFPQVEFFYLPPIPLILVMAN